MSLESYRKNLEAQQKREKIENIEEKEEVYTSEADHYSDDQIFEESIEIDNSRPQKRGIGKIIIAIAVIAILFLAALKNPSKTDAKAEVNGMITEKVMEKIQGEMTNIDDEESIGSTLGSALASLFIPSVIDKIVNIEVSDYIFFTTYDANISIMQEKKTIVSGVILFGKVIPLHTDIDTDALKGSD